MANQLKFHKFEVPFWDSTGLRQRVQQSRILYFDSYLSFFKCAWVVEETSYIDRDYHADFAEFYSTMAVELPSTCKRFHLFARKDGGLDDVSEMILKEAAGGEAATLKKLRDAYLGFFVIRPVGVPAFGRTILRCYPEEDKPRQFGTRQKYLAHVGGVELPVDGIPWQEQDGGVSACASVALWSMFQSIAPREGIHLPTTAEVTRATTRFSMPNGRAIPPGLELGQMCLGIRELGLAPVVLVGERLFDVKDRKVFSPEMFREYTAMLLEARLPFVVGMTVKVEDPSAPVGQAREVGHAVTVVGYQRGTSLPATTSDEGGFAQAGMPVVYIHDDNYGPGMRHQIEAVPDTPASKAKNPGRPVVAGILPKRDSPGATPERKDALVPEVIIAAVPERVRLSPEELLKWGTVFRKWAEAPLKPLKLEVFREVAYVRQIDYIQNWLSIEKGLSAEQVGPARYAMQSGPMLPRYLGVIRLRTRHFVLGDIILDTTASPVNPRICATLEMGLLAQKFVSALQRQLTQFFLQCSRVYID